ncbi:MAG: MFS transporter [Sporichthyaceae bacterium]
MRTSARPVPASGWSSRLDEDGAWQTVFFLLCAALFALWVLDPPLVPDLAAQTARAQAVRDGAYLWWTGWFGGLTLPAYSVVSPFVMAKLGVAVSAAAAGLVACAAAPTLFAGSRRPRAAAAVFGAGAFLNVATGRVTFALGFAAAVLAAAFLRNRRGRSAAAAGLIACLLSPLAGLWLGLIALTVAIADATRRRLAIGVAAALAVVAGLLAVAFPSGTMSFPLWHAALGAVAIVVVYALCPLRVVRVGAVVFGVALIAFALVPSAVGTNMSRLVWLTAAPVFVATAAPVLRRAGVTVLAAAALAWPVTDLTVQVAAAESPQAQEDFYAPLVDALQRAAVAAGPSAVGQRVEIVDPVTHWSAAYVAPTVPIARGWDRQADRAANPLFYDGTLTEHSYRAWLSELAVRWVALPTEASVDYAAKAEADLVRTGPPYLTPVWSDANWTLYAVQDAAPLVRGASVVDLDPGAVTFNAPVAGTVHLQIRYSPLLTLRGADGRVAGCVREQEPWTAVEISEPGTYTLRSQLALLPKDAETCA